MPDTFRARDWLASVNIDDQPLTQTTGDRFSYAAEGSIWSSSQKQNELWLKQSSFGFMWDAQGHILCEPIERANSLVRYAKLASSLDHGTSG